MCCIFNEKYISETSNIRGDIIHLWLTTTKPTKAASKDTISNWIKEILKRANLGQFAPHSIRSAGTSKAEKSINIDTVLKAGGWSSKSTFAKFYNKPVHIYEGIDQAILGVTCDNNDVQ